MVKILDRYVFFEALKYFTLSLATFLTLFAVIDLVSNVELFMKYGVKTGLSYISGRFPLYGVRVIPIATLIATMSTLSRFSSTSELTVVKALGISIYRFSLPLFFLSAVATSLSLFLQEKAVPLGLQKVKKIEALREKVSRQGKVYGVWLKNPQGDFVFFYSFEPKSNTGRRVSLLEVKDFRPVKRIDALEAEYVGKGKWRLKEIFVRELTSLKVEQEASKTVNLGVSPKEILLSSVTPETMSLTKLALTITRFRKMGYQTRELKLELFSRLALSLLPFVVTLLGIPFGVFNPRNKKGYTALFAALLIVTMWIVISLFLSLGKSGVLPPSYAAFAPLFMFGALGLILLGRVET
jgi:lipopolysaccharide export system permease protein